MSESSPSETFTVSISVSNTVNVPASIPGDYGSAIIPSVYDEEYFSMDLTFSVTSSISGSVPVSNVVFSFTPNVEGLSINTVSNSVIRVSGTPTNVFNQTYTFLKNDFTVGTLPYNTPNTQWLAIVGWTPPSVTIATITHDFTVNYTGGPSNLSTPQNIVWEYSHGIIRFQNLIAQGDY